MQSILQSRHSSRSVKGLISAVLEYGLQIHLLDCTLDHGTSSIAVILTKKGMGWFVGMSTNINVESCIERGICEALSTYAWSMNNVHSTQASVFKKTDITANFCDVDISDVYRVLAWSREDFARNGSFFIVGDEQLYDTLLQKQTMDASNMLNTICKGQVFIKIARQSYLDEVKFSSVRVIAANLYKLSLYERLSTPVLNGVSPTNRFPHPFP